MKIRSLRQDLVVSGALQSAWVIVNLATSVVLARALGPGGKGLIDYYALVTYFITELAGVGIAPGILYVIAREKVDVTVGLGLSAVLAAGLGGASAGVLVVYSLFGPSEYRPALIAAAAASPFLLFRVFWSSVATAMNRVPTTYVVQAFGAVVVAGMLVLLLDGGWLTPATGVAAMTLGTILTSSVVAYRYGRTIGYTWRSQAAGAAWKHGRQLFPGYVLNLLTFRLDQVAVAYHFGPADLGIYALGARLAEGFWLLDQVLIGTALYRITTLGRSESWRLTRQTAALVAGLGAALILGSLIAGQAVIVLIFGDAFRPAFPIYMILLIAGVAWSVGRVLAQYLGLRLGRFLDCTIGALIAGVCTVSLLGYLMFLNSGTTQTDIAMASLISYTLATLTYVYLIARVHRVHHES